MGCEIRTLVGEVGELVVGGAERVVCGGVCVHVGGWVEA